ncbi:MAG: hypothetical protein AAGG01_08890, partial [Planctomycetota bacterium]
MAKSAGWWLRGLAASAIVATTAVSVLFVAGPPGTPGWARIGAAALWVGGAAVVLGRLAAPWNLAALLALAAAVHLGLRLVPARSKGPWATDHAHSPLVTFEGDTVEIEHFRAFRYESGGA